MIRYCLKLDRKQDGKTYYMHIFSDPRSVKEFMLKPELIYKIDVRQATEDEAITTPYYGFLNNEGKIENIYPTFGLFDMCYPYGALAEEKAGKGKIIKVIITEIGHM
jgi:hypothetical protein